MSKTRSNIVYYYSEEKHKAIHKFNDLFIFMLTCNYGSLPSKSPDEIISMNFCTRLSYI